MPVKKIKRSRTCVIEELKKQNKINDLFEIMLANISFEDLLAVKLASISRTAGQPIDGLPIIKSLYYMVREGVLKYAISVTDSKIRAARLLGMKRKSFLELLKIHGIENLYQVTIVGEEHEHSINTREVKKDLQERKT
jgi:hypothetical protein